jgi:hypothetical protein
MGMKRENNLPDGLNEAARRASTRFEAKYKAYMEDLRQKVALTILVWGPNLGSQSPVANKRKEIFQALQKLGHKAVFSENINVEVGNVSEKMKEFAQALAADLIIILLEDAPGALAEAHDFCNHPDLAPKIYVMIPRKYEGGYSAQGAIKDLDDGYGGVYWYAEEELEICNVRTKAVRRAEARRCIYSYLQVRGTQL